MPRFLREDDVNTLLSMDDAISMVRRAFRSLAQGTGMNTPRVRPRLPRHAAGTPRMLQTMSAALEGLGFGLKAYTVASGGVRFVVLLWDDSSGDLLAMMEADRLGVVRTGAASGVATECMAREEASVLGVYGSGHQAFAQVEAICAVRPITELRVFSPTIEHRNALARRAETELALDAVAVDEPAHAARNADIVVTITNAAEPVLRSEWIAEGAHVVAAGSNRPQAAELDPAILARARLVAVDSRDQAGAEAGDILHARQAGYDIRFEELVELSELVAGSGEMEQDGPNTGTGQAHSAAQFGSEGGAGDLTVFESLGIAAEDVAVARLLYDRALATGHGSELPQTIL
jgi:ornithine cyclodeaminase/alanine dehydrogenase-like protein (mu-crystallin family)